MKPVVHAIAGLAILLGSASYLLGFTTVAGGCVLVLVVCAFAAGGEP